MSERIPMGEDIRQALRGDGWTLDEADEGIARIKAEALREAHERIGQATRNGDNFFSALLDEADRIEREAGL